MLDIVQVQAIVDQVISIVKPQFRDGSMTLNKQGHYPELWPGYNQAIAEKQGLIYHIEQGHFAERLIRDRSPNQTEQEFAYIKANAKQVTLPVYADFENTLRRALADGNWTLTFKKPEDGINPLEEYITKGIEEFDSVLSFVRYLLPKLKTLDPMGLLVVTPGEYPTAVQEDGTEVIDQETELEPQIEYIPVERVWGFKTNAWYMWLTMERSMVLFGGQNKPMGLILQLVDESFIYRIVQVGKFSDWQFEIVQEYQHNMGYPPADQLKGTPAIVNGKLIWQSAYLLVKDILDLAYLDAQNLMVIKNACAYPNRVMVGDDCDFVDEQGAHCNGLGTLRQYDMAEGAEGRLLYERPCPKCKGSGIKSRMGPMGVLHIRPKDQNTGQAEVQGPAMYFVEPSTTNTQFLSDQKDKNIELAREMLHLRSETAEAGGTQPETATNGGLRFRSTVAFIKPISDQMFRTIDFLIDAIGRMRYGPEYASRFGYSLVPPTNLDLRTEGDIIADIEAAKKAGLPPAVIDRMIWKFITSRYESDPATLDAFEVIAKADRLMGMEWAQITAEAAAKRAESWEVLLHYSALPIYEQAARENGFFDLEPAEKADRLKQLAKTMVPTPQQQAILEVVKPAA